MITMNVFSIMFIGLIQGLLEWLPISSSGQISIILMKLFNVKPSEAFKTSLTLHMGTALTSTLIFRKLIFKEIQSKLKDFGNPLSLVLLLSTTCSIITGTPIYIVFSKFLERLSMELATSIIGIALIATGIMEALRGKSNHTYKEINSLNLRDAIILGIIQGFSVIPGISRSAITISCLLALKYKGEAALTISYIASIPISFAVGLYGLIRNPTLESILGIIVAFTAGILSIKSMLTLARKLNFSLLMIFLGFIMTIQLALIL